MTTLGHRCGDWGIWTLSTLSHAAKRIIVWGWELKHVFGPESTVLLWSWIVYRSHIFGVHSRSLSVSLPLESTHCSVDSIWSTTFSKEEGKGKRANIHLVAKIFPAQSYLFCICFLFEFSTVKREVIISMLFTKKFKLHSIRLLAQGISE